MVSECFGKVLLSQPSSTMLSEQGNKGTSTDRSESDGENSQVIGYAKDASEASTAYHCGSYNPWQDGKADVKAGEYNDFLFPLLLHQS